jgi:hypothetical protein
VGVYFAILHLFSNDTFSLMISGNPLMCFTTTSMCMHLFCNNLLSRIIDFYKRIYSDFVEISCLRSRHFHPRLRLYRCCRQRLSDEMASWGLRPAHPGNHHLFLDSHPCHQCHLLLPCEAYPHTFLLTSLFS